MGTRRSVLFGLALAWSGRATAAAQEGSGAVLTGIDVLAAEGFTRLAGRNIGLITNQTGRDRAGRRTVDVLHGAPGVRLRALFSPEHGLEGRREGRVASGVDARTGLAVHSLYGGARRPTAEMLAGLDALVVDLQDVGVRFFTYATTVAYALEAAAPRGLEVMVLDRPNPIAPAGVRGPMLDPDRRSFTGYISEPVQHAMTLGELARLFNVERGLGARLTVVAMRGWRRSLWFDQTGLGWIDPSPNLRSLTEAILYPGIGLVEGTNLSVGRGTPTPFEIVGAPWVGGAALAAELRGRGLAGVRPAPASFTPTADRHAGRLCQGVRLTLTDREALDAPRLGVELALALRRLHPDRFALDGMIGNLGSARALAAIAAGGPAEAVIAGWRAGLDAFLALRRRHLIYP
jgi:uncharacterized protein YbbC (DUF1343 family)